MKSPKKTKKPIKATNFRKKKKTTFKKVPKTDPKEQRVLKNLFKTTRSGKKQSSSSRSGKKQSSSSRSGKKQSSGLRRPSPRPPSQQVWRRTVVRPKPKPNPNDKLPKLFRMDQSTGLPVDYERTVQRMMHYVNPHLASRPNAENVLEDLLTNMFAELVRTECRDQQPTLKRHPCRVAQFLNGMKKDCQLTQNTREANDNLSEFHSACKRGPRPISPKLGPTHKNSSMWIYTEDWLKKKRFLCSGDTCIVPAL